jgi:general secretion pathway protein E
MVPNRGPVTFEELLGVLVREGMLTQDRAQELYEHKDRQLARLLQEQQRAAANAGPASSAGPRSAEPVAIGPIELVLSFGVTDPRGRSLSEDKLTELYARQLGIPYVKLDPLKLDAAFVTGAWSRAFARKHTMLAIADLGTAIRVALLDPFDRWGLETAERSVGRKLELVIASKGDIQRLITEFYGFRRSVKNAEDKLSTGVDIGNLEQLVRMKTANEIEASDEHVVHAVEYLMSYAFQQRASDIHIEPKRDEAVVRFRIDGALHEVNRIPPVVHKAVVNRIKTLSRLDIGEKRRPQDGRIKTEFDGKAVELRVSTLAVAFGEKVVMRIFDPEIVHDDLGKLGFAPRELEIFAKLIARPHGIVLVTGPTGSGKTTTLYTALRKLATDDVNITTIEDPIEMVFERINQTAINAAVGLGFAETLRTLLRQDPDIIMVGEIRDLDTARHAIQAALTGHLVFSTLHTNDAAGAVTRLLDLGAEHFLLASTLSGLMAQRLLRKVCAYCAVTRPLTPAEEELLGPALPAGRRPVQVREGAGCVECRQSGYFGRSAIYELIEINDSVRRLVMQRADATAIKAQARRDGMLTLREAAVRKLLAGETTLDEVLAVTHPDD